MKSIEIHAAVRAAEAEQFEKSARYVKKNASPPGQYKEGDFVLLYRERPEKLLMEWSGPHVIIGKGEESEYVYWIKNLLTSEEKRAHANTLHPFVAGAMTPEQLRFEATEHDEFLVSKVLKHQRRKDGQLRFLVIWQGYERDGPSWV
jgi:hypothetical protein